MASNAIYSNGMCVELKKCKNCSLDFSMSGCVYEHVNDTFCEHDTIKVFGVFWEEFEKDATLRK